MPKFNLEFTVRRTGLPWEASVFSQGEKVAEVRKGKGPDYVLHLASKGEWLLTPRVKGEIKPFSMRATKSKGVEEKGNGTGELTIRERIFFHGGKCYMLASAAEGRPLREHLAGAKYICRIEDPPFADIDAADHFALTSIRKYRGTAIGEMEGSGFVGHRVKLSDELADIGLPLAATSYLLYASA